MRSNQQVVEITGTPAQVWGSVLIPARGTIAVQITGDTLQGTVKTGLEKKESWTRIQNIDSIEILESPIYALLGVGGSLIASGLGALTSSFIFGLVIILAGTAIMTYAINNKRRYLTIHSYRNTITVFMSKSPEAYQQFAINVLAIARQLNAPVNASTRQPQHQVR